MQSRVIHRSLDPTIPTIVAEDEDEGGGGGEGNEEEKDPDRVLTNSRRAVEEDGLLDDGEMVGLFRDAYACGDGGGGGGEGDRGPVWSVYDRAMESLSEEHANTFGAREEVGPGRKGRYEPLWTNFTHYWRLTLGIFPKIQLPLQEVY